MQPEVELAVEHAGLFGALVVSMSVERGEAGVSSSGGVQ
jgi:hypothetical protein